MHALKALWPGSIKRLFGSSSNDAKPASTPAPAVAPARPPQPAAKVQAPTPKAAPAPGPVQKPKPAPAMVADEKLLHLPLKPIFDRLSPALQALANAEHMSDADEIALQLSNILPQLPGGIVRISFGELRHAAPAGVFADQNSHDYTLIDVPLSEILARINPTLLERRTNRKRIDVPEDVTGVFGKNGGGTAVIAAPEPVQPVHRQTKPAPAAPAAPVAPAPTLPAMPSAPARSRVVIPPPPPGGDVIQFTKPAAPVAPAKPAEPAAPVAEPAAPIKMPAIAKQAAAPTPAAAPAAPVKPEPEVEPLVVAITALNENWPAAIKTEVEQARPTPVSVALPMARLEGPMKTGKLTFKWSDIRQWMKPAPLSGTSAHGEVEIQFALNVIAPIFFSHPARGKVAAKKAEVGQDIPDVFGSTSKANALRELAATPIMKPAVPGAPAAPAMPPVNPAVAAQGGAATNVQLRGAQPLSNGNGNGHTNGVAPTNRMQELTNEPVMFSKAPAAPAKPTTNGNGALADALPKIDWTPDQAVKITCGSPAVAGAMIAAEDGLMVATQLPAQFKSEMLSAFVPQIFGRASQSATELNLPALTSVRLSFGEQQCEIFKTGKLYYVIVGKPGEELPSQVLRKIAAELTKRN